MNEEKRLQQRLQRIARNKSTRKTSRTKPRRDVSGLQPGEPQETPHGTAYIIETQYPGTQEHGSRRLNSLTNFESKLTAEIATDPALEGIDLDDLVFLDTETNGLAGGAGTVAFLVGIGKFIEGDFWLRQYFLRDLSAEQAMLHAIESDLGSDAGFVTFNGRTFDVPLLEMRFTLGMRKRFPLSGWPHLDLLYPARRLWRRTLPDCRLNTIEREVLGVQRSGEDVPGELIPGLYLDYLRTGDPREMERVIYHNAVDILSLVGLTGEVLDRHRTDALSNLSAAEAFGVARWHQGAGRRGSAESAYRAAIESSDPEIRLEALRHHTVYLKQLGQRDQAVDGWKQWHKLKPDDPRPCIELAMYYEWHARDLDMGKNWAEVGLTCLSNWANDWRCEEIGKDLQHRINRLKRKLDSRP
ncbi:MAG: ribonuclease H-like domain-containing protein [Anaerolineales bacterium]